ncbi:MAG TPA: 4'-phosphopantetheinyl transferase superfamily protein [Cellvibrio sp.]
MGARTQGIAMQPSPELQLAPQPLQPGQVHLWLLDVRQFSNPLAEQALLLMSDDERERAQKFIRGKEEYIASRWLLRKVLGQYLQQAPASLVFNRSEKGKPYIANNPLKFNLSHSGHWALLALAQEMELGVDIEQVRNSRDLLGIAENYYHPDEYAQLRQRHGDEQLRFFYQLWTLKEALLKAMGVGISAGLENLNFDLQNPISVSLSPVLQAQSVTDKWQFHQWQLPDTSYCALAVAATDSPQTCWFDPLTTLT